MLISLVNHTNGKIKDEAVQTAIFAEELVAVEAAYGRVGTPWRSR
jgi:hypothetical protein